MRLVRASLAGKIPAASCNLDFFTPPNRRVPRLGKPGLRVVHGQPSWRIASDQVEAFVTRTGGHVGPITFDRHDRRIVLRSSNGKQAKAGVDLAFLKSTAE